MGTWGTALVGTPLLTLGGLLIYGFVALWPAVTAAVDENPGSADISFFGITYNASPDTALILFVAISSAFGSFIHAATSFGDYPAEDRAATYVDSNTLEFELEDGDVAESGTLTLSVVNPSGGVSPPFDLLVTSPDE